MRPGIRGARTPVGAGHRVASGKARWISVRGQSAQMRRRAVPASSVHFNGSVNLPDAEAVMREISSRIPNGVRRMTDGETGDRGYWIQFQIQKFLQMPEFESVAVRHAYETSSDAPQMPQLRLAEGASAA